MAKPGLFGDVVGKPYGGAAGVTPVNPAAIAQESRRVDKTFPPYAEQHAAIMRNRYPGGQTTVSAARPWANIQAQMLSDPRQGVSGMRIPPAELMGDKKTVREIFADPTKSDKITETITQKVPVGDMRIPTSELTGTRNFTPTRQPTSIMDMMIPIGELMEMRRRRDQMRFRQNPIHLLQRR